ncbi:hypothetical protein A2U01_0081705, partial [Trifolium medium]|nr:hypothetical protein [Trifolium medium]
MEVRRNGDTRTSLRMGLGLYCSYPLRIGTSLGKPKLYGFGFGKSKTRRRPASLPCLHEGATGGSSTLGSRTTIQ